MQAKISRATMIRENSTLHPRNQHLDHYNFKKLVIAKPELEPFVGTAPNGTKTIDFSKPQAVRILNAALLKHFYKIEYWEIPSNYLCPPVPGRADYIQNIADLLSKSSNDKIPKGKSVKCMDIGVGANCIYPLIGTREFGWSFIGTDIDQVAIESAQNIISKNPSLKVQIEFRLQANPKGIFYGVFQKDDVVDIAICNPPFHSSQANSESENIRKTSNLKRAQEDTPKRNFGGQQSELWCVGGEKRFIQDMVHQSKEFAKSCLWFTALVSNKDNLYGIKKALAKAKVDEVKVIPMWQGNKASRIIAWTFKNEESRTEWALTRWK